MYMIMWEYRVREEHVAEFEEAYASDGAWTKLFQRSKGFLGTELLRDVQDRFRYITIDRWFSSQDHESFLLQWKTEYAALDTKYEGFMMKEILLGKYEVIFR